jgi:hypothetical protein
MSDQDRTATSTGLFATIFQQNWENVRGIKSERIWFMNTYSVISAGSLTLVQSIRGERVIELTLILALCLLSLVGLISSLRLKAELEECLEKIEAMVLRAQVDEFVALGRPEGRLLRYPAFRWVFPIFYCFGTALFVGLLVYRLTAGGQP